MAVSMQISRRCLALVALSAFLAATVGCSRNDEFEPRPFDPMLWKTDDNVRGEMVDDLLHNYVKIGMRRTRVLRLLGPADFSGERATEDGAVGPEDVYFIGRYKNQEADYLALFYIGGRLHEIGRPIGVPVSSISS
jgi:hypothetical protein